MERLVPQRAVGVPLPAYAPNLHRYIEVTPAIPRDAVTPNAVRSTRVVARAWKPSAETADPSIDKLTGRATSPTVSVPAAVGDRRGAVGGPGAAADLRGTELALLPRAAARNDRAHGSPRVRALVRRRRATPAAPGRPRMPGRARPPGVRRQPGPVAPAGRGRAHLYGARDAALRGDGAAAARRPYRPSHAPDRVQGLRSGGGPPCPPSRRPDPRCMPGDRDPLRCRCAPVG